MKVVGMRSFGGAGGVTLASELKLSRTGVYLGMQVGICEHAVSTIFLAS